MASSVVPGGVRGTRPERLDLLDGDDPHASVRAVFSWSYLHLPAAAARLFRLLGLHPAGHLDDRAAAALAGIDRTEARRLLSGLTRAHLVQPVDSHRYGMHDLLRAYAAERAAHDGQDDQRAARTGLFDHYVTTAEAAARAVSGGGWEELGPADARAWLDVERATLVAVSAHAARHGWDEHAVALARALEEYLDSGGHYVDALTMGTHARDAARRLGDRAAESYLLGMLGYNEGVRGGTIRA